MLNKCIKCGRVRDGKARCAYCLRVKAKKYRRTMNGLISIMYSSQKHNSKMRGHKPPTYSKSEFAKWVLSQKNFKKLFKKWVKSDYKMKKKPSVDRLDELVGYSMYNIRLVSFKVNCAKEYKLHKNAMSVNNDGVGVVQYSMDGVKLAEYDSMALAERATAALQPNIHKVCNGQRNSAGGFIWEYLNEK